MMESKNINYQSTTKAAAMFLIMAAIILLLQYFRTFLQPFVVALILWFIIHEVRFLLGKIKIKGRTLPKPLLTIISTLVVFYLFNIITQLIIFNFQSLAANAGKYNQVMLQLASDIEQLLGVNNLDEAIGNNQQAIVSAASLAAKGLATLIGNFFLVIIYVIFLLLEEGDLGHKLRKIYARSSSRQKIRNSVNRIMKLFSDYLGIKIITSFLTGFFSFFILLYLDIDLPMLWAFLIFILNFIPSIGSIVATSFPVLFALLQYYGDWSKPVYVLVGILAIQVAIGNFLEPKLLGNKLNLSPLVVLLGLAFWGYVWGFVGMLLSVPIDAMLMIIFSQFESTRNAAILFSKDGNIEYLFEDTVEKKKEV
ncbi:MAG TPA: AI-2E family transporter [Flammeovirgaceae bacterium]|nr:AI-2E family transporter [Flammeovirgaceae bacterium]